jgi:hypothetical protein
MWKLTCVPWKLTNVRPGELAADTGRLIHCRKPPFVADKSSQTAPLRRHIVASRLSSPIHCHKPPLVADTLSQAAPRHRTIVASLPSSPIHCHKPPLVADQKIIVADYISGKNRFDNPSFLKKWLAQTLTIFL